MQKLLSKVELDDPYPHISANTQRKTNPLDKFDELATAAHNQSQETTAIRITHYTILPTLSTEGDWSAYDRSNQNLWDLNKDADLEKVRRTIHFHSVPQVPPSL